MLPGPASRDRHEAALRDVPLLPGFDRSMIHPPDARVFMDVLATLGLDQSGARMARLARFEPAERATEFEIRRQIQNWIETGSLGHWITAFEAEQGRGDIPALHEPPL